MTAAEPLRDHEAPAEDLAVGERARLGAAALFRAHARFVARMLHRAGVSQPELDDLVQEVFLVAHRRGGFDPGRAKPTTWLAQIALRIAANHRRRHQRRGSDALVDERMRSGATADAAMPAARAQAALWRLDEDKRLVFMLFELEGVPCDEIAATLGIPVGTVYSRLSAARAAFIAAVEGEARP
ncbi:MAG: RNA polymerase sigma factor [Deltaproteobacteria bacterium]|nr:RNA polymerase sigma factor [Nannocystaceae bacterium]